MDGFPLDKQKTSWVERFNNACTLRTSKRRGLGIKRNEWSRDKMEPFLGKEDSLLKEQFFLKEGSSLDRQGFKEN
jgi:hypothetical protein